MLGHAFKRVPVRFYRTESGTEPVRDWLQSLSKADRKKIGGAVATVEYGWPVGMPACRSIGSGLWEVRSELGRNRIAQVLFCFADGQMILLHGFMKKTRKTPAADLAIAKTRKREIER